MTRSAFVSVVVPLRDDADILPSFLAELTEVLGRSFETHEILLVDDGSTDGTPALIDQLLKLSASVRYLRLAGPHGAEIAILAGLDAAIGDVVVVLQPESDPPALVPQFAQEAARAAGVVFGLRTIEPRDPLLYAGGRRVFLRLFRNLVGIELPTNATLYMAFTRQVLNALLQIKDKSRAMRVFGNLVGFPRRYVSYAPVLRRSPPRRRSTLKGLDHAVNLMVTNTVRPLRLVSYLGLLASFMNVVYVGYVFVVAIVKRTAEGWITLSLQSASMFFCLFIILTVLTEYIGRLLVESRDRPPYFLAEERSSPVMLAGERRNVVHESA